MGRLGSSGRRAASRGSDGGSVVRVRASERAEWEGNEERECGSGTAEAWGVGGIVGAGRGLGGCCVRERRERLQEVGDDKRTPPGSEREERGREVDFFFFLQTIFQSFFQIEYEFKTLLLKTTLHKK